MTDAASPLAVSTPPGWAASALEQPLELLEDHAHLERKAATNALGLLSRMPRRLAAGDRAVWRRRLTGIARDEVEHLGLVLALLEERGGTLGGGHRNPYAADLRARESSGPSSDEVLVDRLLTSGLIEARSAERFGLLHRAAADPDLARLYRGLEASERGHHRTFLLLAASVVGAKAANRRWAEWVDREAEVIRLQAPGPRMHSGWEA